MLRCLIQNKSGQESDRHRKRGNRAFGDVPQARTPVAGVIHTYSKLWDLS